jgi:hypothetical protein
VQFCHIHCLVVGKQRRCHGVCLDVLPLQTVP